MGLVPEFFVVLGIVIFLAMSLLSALLDDEMPTILQYLFQGAALAGLGTLLISQLRSPTDPTRFWLSIGYLSSAVSSEIGLSVYLAAVRRKVALSSTLAGTVTAPTFIVSAIFASSYVGGVGGLGLSPAAIVILGVAVFVIGLSSFGFLREAYKHIRKAPVEPILSPSGPVSAALKEPRPDFPSHPSSTEDDIWAAFLAKKRGP